MITFTGAVDTAQLNRDEVIALHEGNVAAIRRRIELIQRSAPGPGDADTLRQIASLEADIADQLELTELARACEYPYSLAGADDRPAQRGARK